MMGAEEPGLSFCSEPVAVAPDVEHVAVVQPPVQDRWGDDGVAQQFAPIAALLPRITRGALR